MGKKLLYYCCGWISVLVFSNQFYFLLSSSSPEIMESLVFEPFSWFVAVLFFVIGVLSISRLIFYTFFPNSKRVEKLIYGFTFLVMIILYRVAALAIVGVAVIYAIMEGIDYSKRIQRYKRREY
ncbi:hypothetical protein J2S74_005133 [Evansella vedderi]|uniref:Uncharacterized protein n=1 Tax=Evansella vedderi TaxID=38282 RepID=A0ABU0A2F2_9BACI|nr:hypothetical protein [Evansella vedderi]MDQ0257671.1 hypothetical protein [Evansella vedderi]